MMWIIILKIFSVFLLLMVMGEYVLFMGISCIVGCSCNFFIVNLLLIVVMIILLWLVVIVLLIISKLLLLILLLIIELLFVLMK